MPRRLVEHLLYLAARGKTKMKTKTNCKAGKRAAGYNHNETLLRDSRNLKIKTAVRAGAAKKRG